MLVDRPMQGGQVRDLPELAEVRDYGISAQILSEPGIHEMILLTNARQTMVAPAGYGLTVVEQREIAGTGDSDC